jgi:hypothetical protein
MTGSVQAEGAVSFEKGYPSETAAEAALIRSRMARSAGVDTPVVLQRRGPKTLGFERIDSFAAPSLLEMVRVLQSLHRMPSSGLNRYDPFRRIRPRLAIAPPHIRALVTDLEDRDADLHWSEAAVIHGDFHPGQVLRDPEGKIWIVDLDDLALGPCEADLGNLAAWIATQKAGVLRIRTRTAMIRLLALSPTADPALVYHFCRIALVRRALKLAEKGLPWVINQLPVRA